MALTNIAPFEAACAGHVVASSYSRNSYGASWTAPCILHLRNKSIVAVKGHDSSVSLTCDSSVTLSSATQFPRPATKATKCAQAACTDHSPAIRKIWLGILSGLSHIDKFRFHPIKVPKRLVGFWWRVPQVCRLRLMYPLVSLIQGIDGPHITASRRGACSGTRTEDIRLKLKTLSLVHIHATNISTYNAS